MQKVLRNLCGVDGSKLSRVQFDVTSLFSDKKGYPFI